MDKIATFMWERHVAILPAIGQSAMYGDILNCFCWRGSISSYWVEPTDVAKFPLAHRTDSTMKKVNSPKSQNINSAKFEKL